MLDFNLQFTIHRFLIRWMKHNHRGRTNLHWKLRLNVGTNIQENVDWPKYIYTKILTEFPSVPILKGPKKRVYIWKTVTLYYFTNFMLQVLSACVLRWETQWQQNQFNWSIHSWENIRFRFFGNLTILINVLSYFWIYLQAKVETTNDIQYR